MVIVWYYDGLYDTAVATTSKHCDAGVTLYYVTVMRYCRQTYCKTVLARVF